MLSRNLTQAFIVTKIKHVYAKSQFPFAPEYRCYLTRLTEPGSGRKDCRAIPFPRNEDVVDHAHVFGQLDALLPPATKYQSAALWGLVYSLTI
jgi:hypothetical protein